MTGSAVRADAGEEISEVEDTGPLARGTRRFAGLAAAAAPVGSE